MIRHRAWLSWLCTLCVAAGIAPATARAFELPGNNAHAAWTTVGQVGQVVYLYKLQLLRTKVREQRAATWQWQDSSLQPHNKTHYQERRTTNLHYLQRLSGMWHERQLKARRVALSPPYKRQWFCLKSHEQDPRQGWATNTGNGYYGGLQMNLTFQRTYGWPIYVRKGTANNWKWYEQMWVASEAVPSTGFSQWETAPLCGLA